MLVIVLVLSDAVIINGNPCIICPNGPTAGLEYTTPYANSGDNMTCLELIGDALTLESGTDDCGWKEVFAEGDCCGYTAPETLCAICPDGITAAEGDDHVPTYIIDFAKQFEGVSNACGLYDDIEPECCPPSMISPTTTSNTANPSTAPPVIVYDAPPVAEIQYPTNSPVVVMTPAPTSTSMEDTTPGSSTSSSVIDNRCITCPNGIKTGHDDVAPHADEDLRTCAELVQYAATLESGTDECRWAEYDHMSAGCYTESLLFAQMVQLLVRIMSLNTREIL